MSRTIQKAICHDLKILPEYFLPVFTGKKTFEIRYNDRNFHTGDFIRLREWSNGEYTGNYVVKQIDLDNKLCVTVDDNKYVLLLIDGSLI